MTDQPSRTVSQEKANRWGWLNTEVDGKTVRFWIIIAFLITTAVLTFGAWWTYGWDHDPAATAASILAAPIIRRPGRNRRRPGIG